MKCNFLHICFWFCLQKGINTFCLFRKDLSGLKVSPAEENTFPNHIHCYFTPYFSYFGSHLSGRHFGCILNQNMRRVHLALLEQTDGIVRHENRFPFPVNKCHSEQCWPLADAAVQFCGEPSGSFFWTGDTPGPGTASVCAGGWPLPLLGGSGSSPSAWTATPAFLSWALTGFRSAPGQNETHLTLLLKLNLWV